MNDMIVDAVLWVIFAIAVAFIVLGCSLTRRPDPKATTQDPAPSDAPPPEV